MFHLDFKCRSTKITNELHAHRAVLIGLKSLKSCLHLYVAPSYFEVGNYEMIFYHIVGQGRIVAVRKEGKGIVGIRHSE